jgi:polyisoprenoid-binding protein YceI
VQPGIRPPWTSLRAAANLCCLLDMALNRCGAPKNTLPGLFAVLAVLLLPLSPAPALAQPQQLSLQFTPAECRIQFTLGDILHTVHGSFKLKRGDISYDLMTNSVSGAMVVDATSGQSNNRTRDRKMHREILESARFPEIVFRPERVEGAIAPSGTSTVQVHGVFSIHGADHELTMPVQVQIFLDHWTADARFTVPYVKWGIKNPSTFFLRVSESVEIEVHAAGGSPFGGVLTP